MPCWRTRGNRYSPVMRYAVTGSGGFIGQHLMRRLPAGTVPIDVKDGRDVHDPRLGDWLAGVDVVFHLAADPDITGRDWLTNVGGTCRLIELGVRVVFASSAAVYGDNWCGTEDDAVSPVSWYGAAKAASELFLLTDGGHCVLRLGNVWGPGSRSVKDRCVAVELFLLTDGGHCVLQA